MRDLVVDRLKLSYEGLFNVGEVYNVISGFFFEKGYDWHEEMNEEQITPEGKQIRLVLKPWKNYSDYFRTQQKIKILFVDVKDVEVEHEGKILKLNHGLIRLTIEGYIMYDRESEWNSNILHWVLTYLGSRYFFSSPLKGVEQWVKSDVNDVFTRVKNYLNVFKYTYET